MTNLLDSTSKEFSDQIEVLRKEQKASEMRLTELIQDLSY
jgi:hypothetical protein